jgi:hypothetical protein
MVQALRGVESGVLTVEGDLQEVVDGTVTATPGPRRIGVDAVQQGWVDAESGHPRCWWGSGHVTRWQSAVVVLALRCHTCSSLAMGECYGRLKSRYEAHPPPLHRATCLAGGTRRPGQVNCQGPSKVAGATVTCGYIGQRDRRMG